tara:strand:- start:75 stop:644 length:570 start_codon:yes stop_codon:yes gene_type:complete
VKFLEKYNKKKNIRFKSFARTLKLCESRNLKVIVETGTSRGKTKFFFFKKYNWKDGMSTPMFAEFSHFINGTLHTCDISKSNIDNAKLFTKNFSKNIEYYVDDSVNFLKFFPQKIDLLYLDSLDGHDPVAASKHQLNEIKVSMDKLHSKSLILLDDKGSKTNLSIDYLIQNNFKILYETKHQILFSQTI